MANGLLSWNAPYRYRLNGRFGFRNQITKNTIGCRSRTDGRTRKKKKSTGRRGTRSNYYVRVRGIFAVSTPRAIIRRKLFIENVTPGTEKKNKKEEEKRLPPRILLRRLPSRFFRAGVRLTAIIFACRKYTQCVP